MTIENRVRRWKMINNFVALPIFLIGTVPGVFLLSPVHWWFLGVAAVGSLISGLANVMAMRLRKAAEKAR